MCLRVNTPSEGTSNKTITRLHSCQLLKHLIDQRGLDGDCFWTLGWNTWRLLKRRRWTWWLIHTILTIYYEAPTYPNTNIKPAQPQQLSPHVDTSLEHQIFPQTPPEKKHQSQAWHVEPQHKIITSNIQTYAPWTLPIFYFIFFHGFAVEHGELMVIHDSKFN